jgi:hypothetical protein
LVGWGLFQWVYNNHIPRAAFSSSSSSSSLTLTTKSDDDYYTTVNNKECITTIFPFPTNEDFELDSIDPTCNNKKAKSGTGTDDHDDDGDTTKTIGPHFTTPGGTAIFGTLAYSTSSDAYHTLINALQNDASALCWKGKRMRAYQAKPIDKIFLKKAKHYYEIAAMKGDVMARYNLGALEGQTGNHHRATKHFIIAAKAGHTESLDVVKKGFTKGLVTKDEYASVLRAYHERQTEMKSVARDAALKIDVQLNDGNDNAESDE